MRGFRFPRVESGCEAIRRILQRGLRPSVVRLYDELDTAMQRWSKKGEHAPPADRDHVSFGRLLGAVGLGDPAMWRRRALERLLDRPAILNQVVDTVLPRLGGGCLLIVGCEGDRRLAEAEANAVLREMAAAGGRDAGPGPGERWLAHRYDVSFGMSKAFAAGAFTDTMEVATTWDKLLPLYRAVKEAVAPYAFIMAHFSHAYVDGCSIYFTFVGAVPGGDGARAAAEHRYDQIWRSAQEAVVRVGATISHHHGVGLLKSPRMHDEHGEAMRIFGALKQVLDPHGILNPGKLGV
jgi:alkyldihydroxyacetonephosphate synthase